MSKSEQKKKTKLRSGTIIFPRCFPGIGKIQCWQKLIVTSCLDIVSSQFSKVITYGSHMFIVELVGSSGNEKKHKTWLLLEENYRLVLEIRHSYSDKY